MIECQACKLEKETTQKRQSYGYMGAQGIFKNLCSDCAERKLMWYYCLPKANVDSIIIWQSVDEKKEGK